MKKKDALLVTLEKSDLIVIVTTAIIVIVTSLYTFFGVGMKMSALEMTRMSGPISFSSNSDVKMRMMDSESETLSENSNNEKKMEDMGSFSESMNGSMKMDEGRKSPFAIWNIFFMFFMWWFMMIAMMTPSASPTLLLFHNLKKMGPERDVATFNTYLFLVGYLTCWGVFSLFACISQVFLEFLGLISGMMMQFKSTKLSGALLIVAGAYQFTPLKNACLEKCRSPIDFLSSNNRKGYGGSLLMGAHHGLFCLGCCWALMALLFVGGVMNLFWIIGLALYVAIEKLFKKIYWLDKVLGLLLIGVGSFLLI